VGLDGVRTCLSADGQGFYHVETIAATSEAIYAATAIDGSGAPVYLHCKLSGTRLDALIRATSQAAADAGTAAFNAILA
jgi:hypothetical protein